MTHCLRRELLSDYGIVPHVQAGFFELAMQPNGLNRQIKLLKLGRIESDVCLICVCKALRFATKDTFGTPLGPQDGIQCMDDELHSLLGCK